MLLSVGDGGKELVMLFAILYPKKMVPRQTFTKEAKATFSHQIALLEVAGFAGLKIPRNEIPFTSKPKASDIDSLSR